MADKGRTRHRRKAKRSTATGPPPSSAMYVGYVEDEESIDAIMKKFQKLDEIKEIAKKRKREDEENEDEAVEGEEAPGGVEDDEEDGPLDQEQLEQVFKETSLVPMKQLQKETLHIPLSEEMENGSHDRLLYGDFEDGDIAALSQIADDDLWEKEITAYKKWKKSRGRSLPKEKVPKAKTHSGPQRIVHSVLDDLGRRFIVKRKCKVVNPNIPLVVRLPAVIPDSWAKKILPYSETVKADDVPNSKLIKTDKILGANLEEVTGASFEAIYMNPPWSRVTVDDIVEKLQITDKLIPKGMIFIWTPKHLIPAVVNKFSKFNFEYVENLIWVRKERNNKRSMDPSPFFATSKITLLLLRKQVAQPVELRHQRTSDVEFEYIQPSSKALLAMGEAEEVPSRIYETIETLLPNASAINEETGRGAMLELWAKEGTLRPGWTQIVQQ